MSKFFSGGTTMPIGRIFVRNVALHPIGRGRRPFSPQLPVPRQPSSVRQRREKVTEKKDGPSDSSSPMAPFREPTWSSLVGGFGAGVGHGGNPRRGQRASLSGARRSATWME